MCWRSGSLSRTFLNIARSSTTARHLRCPSRPVTNSLRHSFTNSRNLSALASAQSLMQLHGVVADVRLTSISARGCCELSEGTFRRTCQDR